MNKFYRMFIRNVQDINTSHRKVNSIDNNNPQRPTNNLIYNITTDSRCCIETVFQESSLV